MAKVNRVARLKSHKPFFIKRNNNDTEAAVQVFLIKSVLKIFSKFTGRQPSRSAIFKKVAFPGMGVIL